MGTVKKFNSTYTIDGPSVVITGNLNILGNLVSITSNNTSITDNMIVLNAGESGAGVTLGTAGITIARGSLANVNLQWSEAATSWQVTTDGANYANIFTNPMVSNLVTSTYAITSSGGNNIKFGGNLQINYTLSTPSTVPNASLLYASTPTAGASGLYVVNSAVSGQELVTKTRAFGFSLLF
jgi:hypothetical protein